ncbi:molecular chaperone HtpG [Pseudodesulfovibrio tunisiensis]|uniref:molecular chaperone HtpG n=1 Tax=Pseudodesulfovibrio tunisiensis TaxID=463192 RepID=UPI001FB55D92|nr:molecular chaperone HtpG [Pseudodesulfovibrio tunisiensis]
MSKKTTHKFKAEVSQLLEILVHSLYTNKEIFLRELVSNASDALEKYRFHTNSADNGDDSIPLEIRISVDPEAKTLTITDTGVGMTRDELMNNIGTIAHSGTAELTRLAQEGQESLDSLIGRFGVGFYSVYMVADEVELTTRSWQEDAVPMVWTSDGRTNYKLEQAPEDTPRGTSIKVMLKEDLASQFTNEAHLKSVIKRHSNFINFPIHVGDERVNTVSALWREPKFQIKAEQYAEFYKFLTFDTEDPLETMHISVDAPVQFNALMFIPSRSTENFLMNRDNWGLDLYVRRVLIERQNKHLVPEYLSFVKGVVDTEDLPLNISRETLQDNVLMRKISSTLVKQILSHLQKMAGDDAERYAEFWREHGNVFKAGYVDFLNKDKFAELVRFNSSTHEDDKGLCSLADYVGRVREGQKEIYYAYGPSRQALALNPHLEMFRRKGVEVLYLYEPIDEFVMDALGDYRELRLVAAEHADPANLEAFETLEPEKEKPEALSEDQRSSLDRMLARIRELLGESVTEVKVSGRLSDSPVCLSNPDGHVTSSMDKIMRTVHKDASIPQKVLEINPDHALIRNMLRIFERDENDAFVEQAARQLFESALLLEGYLSDPHALVGRVQDLLTKSSGWYADK